MSSARRFVVTALCGALLIAGTGPAHAANVRVSELHFDAQNPTYDRYGSGTRLWGAVSVKPQGYLDFRGRAVVETPDRASLNPGGADFTFGAKIALTRGVGNWNIMQKGYYADRQWKMSIHRRSGGAQLSCRIKGSGGSVHVYTARAVIPANGTWHQVRCSRVGNQVHIRVDGTVVAIARGPIGWVSSTKPYLIGSKGSGQLSDPDQYLGLLDDAFVEVVR